MNIEDKTSATTKFTTNQQATPTILSSQEEEETKCVYILGKWLFNKILEICLYTDLWLFP